MTGLPVVAGWIDSHCHLTNDDAGRALADEAVAAGVVGMVTVGCDVADSCEHADFAAGRADVVATAGVHPHEARHGLDGLLELLDRPEIVAVGECGLDYHYDHSPREVQRDVFAAQIALATERRMTLVIHSRSAWDDTFDVLVGAGVPERTVFHCFTGGPDEAQRALDLGAHLSFSGIVTFPSASDVCEAARLCPDDRLLVETDAPYLAPVPHRGRRNRPALVAVVGTHVAELRRRPAEEIADLTAANARRLFDRP